jgi:signal transduction histidine kinase
MWFPIQVAAYVSLLLAYSLLLVLAVRHRIRRGRAERLLEMALALAIAWTLGLGLLDLSMAGSWWAYVWQRVAQFGLVLLALLTAEFADAFVERQGRRWLRRLLVGLPILAALALDAASLYLPSLDLPYLPVDLGPVELAGLLLVFAWVAASASAWGTALVALRQAIGAKHRNRIRYLLAALTAFVAGDLLILAGRMPDVHIGFAARLLGFAIVTFSLLRYDLPDIRRLSLASLRVALLTCITSALYLLALTLVALLTGTLFRLPRFYILVPSVTLVVVLVALVDVTWGPALDRFLDRTVLGRTYDPQKSLGDYGRRVSLVPDPERLGDATLDWLHAALGVEQAAFILLKPHGRGGSRLEILCASNGDDVPPMVFGAGSRFLNHFRKIGQPLSQYDLDMLTWFHDMPDDERNWLKALRVDLYVPVIASEAPIALLALGPKRGRQPYAEEDLETLMIFAGQTATALENARLVDNLREVQGDIQTLNDELAETNRQLKRLDETKGDFVTIASHELRTPLSQIFGYSDVLASLESDELEDSQVVKEFVSGISRGARRLKNVVDDMIDMSLLETGNLRIHRLKIPISVVVANAVSAVESAAERRGQLIEIDKLSELPHLEADGTRLEQVFVSVLSNAVKFTPDGGRIHVYGRAGGPSAEEGYIEICVADQGIGVDRDQQKLIFEKFYRPEDPMLHSTDDVAFKGAGPGLGLAIARGLVEVHGGRIWVESPGRDEETCPGSIFYIRLPIHAPSEE